MTMFLLFTAAFASSDPLPVLEMVLPLLEASTNDHFIVTSHVGDGLLLVNDEGAVEVDIQPVEHARSTLLEITPRQPMTPGIWTLVPTAGFDPIQWRVGDERDDTPPRTPSVRDVMWRQAVGGYRFLEFDLVSEEPVLWEVTTTTALTRDIVVAPVVRTRGYLDNDALDGSLVTLSVRARDAAGNWSDAIEWTGTPQVGEPLQGVRSGCTTGGPSGWSWLAGCMLWACRRSQNRRTPPTHKVKYGRELGASAQVTARRPQVLLPVTR